MPTAIILAAGEGKRMKSDKPKVLHEICGLPILEHCLRAANFCERRAVIIGHRADEVEAALPGREYILQKEQLGTGHALQQARAVIEQSARVLVLAGDMPLLRRETLEALMAIDADAAVLTVELPVTSHFGRVLREGGKVTGIVEYRDATEEQRAVTEMNTSVYAFNAPALLEALDGLTNHNAQGEYYLTDAIALIAERGTVETLRAPYEECIGCNDRAQLAECARLMRARINEAHMLAGVTLIDPAHTYIDADVEIGRDATIHPGNTLSGATKIGSGATLWPNNRIVDSIVGDGAFIESSLLEESVVGGGTRVGPNAHLRKGTVAGQGCRIGNFVETKNVTIGDGAKLSHLAYCGDGSIGAQANISCGVIFTNYDGYHKHHTHVGDGAFIGCNANLIAPVSIGDRAYVAAGSTITEDVPAGALAIARQKQSVKPGWADRWHEAHKE